MYTTPHSVPTRSVHKSVHKIYTESRAKPRESFLQRSPDSLKADGTVTDGATGGALNADDECFAGAVQRQYNRPKRLRTWLAQYWILRAARKQPIENNAEGMPYSFVYGIHQHTKAEIWLPSYWLCKRFSLLPNETYPRQQSSTNSNKRHRKHQNVMRVESTWMVARTSRQIVPGQPAFCPKHSDMQVTRNQLTVIGLNRRRQEYIRTNITKSALGKHDVIETAWQQRGEAHTNNNRRKERSNIFIFQVNLVCEIIFHGYKLQTK